MRRLLPVLASAIALTATTATLTATTAEAAPKPEITAASCQTLAGAYLTGVYTEDGKARTRTVTSVSPTIRRSGTAVGPSNVRADQSIEYHFVYVTTQTQAKKNAAITQTSTTTRVVTDDVRSCYFYEGHGVHSYADTALCEGLYTL